MRRTTLLVLAAVVVVIVAVGAYATLRTRGSAGAAPAAIAVAVTDTACDPDALSVTAGTVTFAIHNASGRRLEWEISTG